MKNSISSFRYFALNMSEMKNVIGGGCGSTCHYPNGTVEVGAGYGTSSKESSVANATQCGESGGRGYWCCASCNKQ